MADAVNFLIESGVSEAELYERAAIFTTSEIQCVFRKRSRFEYILRRRRIDISCYTNYIKFEINLIELLSLRKVLVLFPPSRISPNVFYSQQRLIATNHCAHRDIKSIIVHSFTLCTAV